MDNLDAALAAWSGSAAVGPGRSPDWPRTGIAIEGDFSGIQQFVLRPVPGAGGAARRLRARSFRVLALTKLVAATVEKRLCEAGAKVFYSAGGRFLVVAGFCADWGQRLASLQSELDGDLLRTYHGELVFHLAGAEFSDGKIPVDGLRHAMGHRKRTPLANAVQTDCGWASNCFCFRATQAAKCDGCGSTAVLNNEEDDGVRVQLCQTCVDDRELGKALLHGTRAGLGRSPRGSIAVLGEKWTASSQGEIPIPLISHAPVEGDGLATFEQLARRSAGRQYLAYLRIDADRIGQEFSKLEGNPQRTWGLSRLLDEAFTSGITKLLQTRFPNLYPVYGGGDDLFLIGPWNDALKFAVEWRNEFRGISGDRLTFSAGCALAKPRQHILTKSEEAKDALDQAKEHRDSIHALGATISWSDFDEVYASGDKLAKFHTSGQIKSALLYNIMNLHDRWVKGDERGIRACFIKWNATSPGRPSALLNRRSYRPDASGNMQVLWCAMRR
ncbi:MAG: hypothetical protein JO307_30695 [Bryobacterales bacterium]|nr:hypothetical protein [Bryobacterales bacterium]MBV9399381.1 hypothetical protein [Bryobacterales bacterium]